MIADARKGPLPEPPQSPELTRRENSLAKSRQIQDAKSIEGILRQAQSDFAMLASAAPKETAALGERLKLAAQRLETGETGIDDEIKAVAGEVSEALAKSEW